MSYADRAARFLAARRAPTPPPATADEENEGNEVSRRARTGGALPRACGFPRACGMLGPCARHDAGSPCLVADGGTR